MIYRKMPVQRSRAPFVIGAVCILLMLAGGAIYLNAHVLFGSNREVEFGGSDILPKPEQMNVLLLGNDARRGESSARTDSIMLACVDPKLKQIALLSIPRDTYVSIPGYGKDKINHAAVYGGPELTAKAVSQLLGVTVSNYVMVDYEGFVNVVDILGGLDYDVETNMFHADPENGYAYQIDLKKGLQHMDGDKSLQYVRYRSYATGDIERSEHQQRFFVALAKELLQPSSILKLPNLVPEISRNLKTNLSTSDLLKLASSARYFEEGSFIAQTLPGWNMDVGGSSCWGVDTDNAKMVLAKLMNGETVSTVILSGSSPSSSSQSQNTVAAGNDNTPVQQSTTETTQGNQQPANQQSANQQPSSSLGQGIARPTNTANNPTTDEQSTTPNTSTPAQETPASGEGNQSGTTTETPTPPVTEPEPTPVTTPEPEPTPTPEPDTDTPDITPGIPGARTKT